MRFWSGKLSRSFSSSSPLDNLDPKVSDMGVTEAKTRSDGVTDIADWGGVSKPVKASGKSDVRASRDSLGISPLWRAGTTLSTGMGSGFDTLVGRSVGGVTGGLVGAEVDMALRSGVDGGEVDELFPVKGGHGSGRGTR